MGYNKEQIVRDYYQQDMEGELSQKKQKQKEKQELNKLMRKLKNGIEVIEKQEEKKQVELFSKEVGIGTNMFVIHMGNGDEEDYRVIDSFIKQTATVDCELNIFAGISYGMIECSSIEMSQKIVEQCQMFVDEQYKGWVYWKELVFGGKKRKILLLGSQIGLADLMKCKNMNIPNGLKQVQIAGISTIDDFISEQEEKEIVEKLDQMKWIQLANRRVQHYGYEFIYGANNVEKDKSINKIPEFLEVLMERLNKWVEKETGGKQKEFNQLTVNDYKPGDGIPAHYDTHSPFEECLVSIGLVSGVVMGFKEGEKNIEEHLHFRNRMLLSLRGEGRYKWYHYIQQRKMDRLDGQLVYRKRRISLTFRKIRNGPCDCQYPQYCDSQTDNPVKLKQFNSQIATSNKKGIFMDLVQHSEHESQLLDQSIQSNQHNNCKPSGLENKYVYEMYDRIAGHFSNTRHTGWPRIEKFIEGLDEYSVLADIGCGNGKYLRQKKVFGVGLDRSMGLLGCARQIDGEFQLVGGDSLKLPFRNDSVDNVISIAVIHHLSNSLLRKQALNEMVRIVKKGGKILVYVWAYEQEQRVFTQQDNFIPWNLQSKFNTNTKQNGDSNKQNGDNNKQNGDSNKQDGDSNKQDGDSNKQDGNKSGQSNQVISDSKGGSDVVYKRYYHVFKKGELDELFEQMEKVQIEDSFYDHANWAVVAKKIQ